MEVRYDTHPNDAMFYTTEELRGHYLIENLFEKGKINTVYSHVDRIIVGGATPGSDALKLEAGDELRAAYFLERRELGIINIGAPGKVTLDGVEYSLGNKDGLYVGMGTKDVKFESDDEANPAKFYFNSAPAHTTYPTVFIDMEKANKRPIGSMEDSNKRTIYQYIHPAVLKTCQLSMGLTKLEEGSMWNTMPCHTHERRMEVYLYFDLPEDAAVFHLMGQPQETRHIVMHNEQAVISPSWSIHSGVGTHCYTFIWGMVGENQDFDDMDHCKTNELK
ncbi:MAG: 5-dehydro-4-deoxy-D-glucuronate isomerase [Clostridia bacterium]|nr:5-dehydro-4-deoxy-D-glucuronate isomerase [Clostridia bacterium]